MDSKAGAALDNTIAKAQHGRVSISPQRAIEMAGKLYGEGKYGQAERVCRQIIEARPSNADAHNILGVTLSAQGKSKEAVTSLRRAIKLAPDAASYHANLGEVLRQSKDNLEAMKALNRAIELNPTSAEAHNNLGIIAYEDKRFDDAVESYRTALSINPQMAEAYNNLGNSLRRVGDRDDAMKAYQDALTVREVYPEAYNNLGTLLKDDFQFEEAEHALRKAISQSPDYVEAYGNLAGLYVTLNRDVEALRVLGDALKIDARAPIILRLTARIQLKRNNFDAAEQAMRRVLHEDPTDAEAMTILGQVLHETDRYELAIQMLEAALERDPTNEEARNFYGVALKSVGRLDEAREHLLEALAQNETLYGAYANLNDLVDFSKDVNLFNKMDTIMESASNTTAPPFLPLHFAYAKALDDRGEHERALQHYIIGGKMKRAQLTYNEAENVDFFRAIREAFPKEAFTDRTYAGNPDARPVFIVGMPRSGSTLVEQILSSHPDVYGAGEVKYLSIALGQLRDRFPSLPKFPKMMGKITTAQMDIAAGNYLSRLVADAGESKRVTDKLLTNYFFVGLINLLFPNARIINTLRDPVDTCLSAFTKLFKDDMPHSYDLGELGRYYNEYQSLLDHWRAVLPEGAMTSVGYEDVVADLETEARRIIEFIGLEWDPRCLDFHKSDRPVKTASVAQVRRPIYTNAVKRSAKYGEGLRPLIDTIVSK